MAIHKLKVTKLDDDYCGVAYQGANRFVIRGALPGELVLAEEQEKFGSITLCRLQKVLTPSPDRCTPTCSLVGACGGCELRHVIPSAQCAYKSAYVRRKLAAVGLNVEVAPTVSAEGLRNKVHLVFGRSRSRVTLGFFNAKTHAVVDAPQCPAHGRWYAPLVGTLKRWATESNIPIYDPATGKGYLRFALVRRLAAGLMVTIVATKPLTGLDSLYTALTKLFPHVSLWQNVNAKRTNEVFGEEFIHIGGERKLSSSMLGIPFTLAPDSFFQTNTQIATQIYRAVCDFIAPQEGADGHILDLYSGIGITSALFASRGYTVDSVESNPSACADSIDTCRRAGVLERVHVHQGEVATILPTLQSTSETALFADPPRAGLGEEVCEAILQLAPSRIAYLSCNPHTLATDLKRLSSAYNIISVTPYDMFPNTSHVESVVCLTRRLDN